MAEIKKSQVSVQNSQVCISSREVSEKSPLFKSQETPSIITGKLPETPKRPPKK